MSHRNGARFLVSERMAVVDPSSLRHFAATVPQLRELLQSSDGFDRELLLQAAMRDKLRALADVSSRAARIEADPLRAEQLRVVSKVALELALTAPH